MNITFLSRGNYTDFVLSELARLRNPDVLVLSPAIVDKIDLLMEAGTQSGTLFDLCVLSESLKCVVVCGCDTTVCGACKRSAIIIDNGKLLGVSDMAHVLDESPYTPGASFRVYDTSRGKIGLIVGEDLFFPETSRILTLCDSDVIICLFGKIYNHIPQLMLRSSAFSNGVCMCMAAEGYIQVADISGEIICSTDAKITECNFDIVKDYHLLMARRRGFYKEICTPF